jgi:hypothetical protein
VTVMAVVEPNEKGADFKQVRHTVAPTRVKFWALSVEHGER